MLSRVNRPGLRVLTRHQCARSISGTHVRSQQTFNVLMLGAGPANFGTMEGPWNHSKRLEKLLGDRLRLVGVVERNFARATDHLERKRADPVVKGSYEETRVFGSLEEAAASLGEERIPRLIIDGLPPGTRGSTMPGCDTEARMATLFPDAAFLIEKPVSTAPLEEVQKVRELLRGRVVSVGYMLRYLQGVQEIKRQLHKHSLTPMLTLARYFVAYSYAADMYRNKTRQYWDTSMERGPIVTQGTHLVDLIRHVTPAFLPGSLHVNTVEHDDVSGKLSALKFDESAEIPVDHRIPRATNASWCTETGGLVNFSHGYLLHEGDYDCELIVMADGWKFALKDPYGVSPRLAIRSPDGPDEVETVFENDDCFEAELRTIIDVVEGRASQDAILSPYADAVETYKIASHHISL